MIVDVTLPISPGLVQWPGDPAISAEQCEGEIKVSRWTLGSHTGTHVDAPIHYSVGSQTADQLLPDVLLGPCRVIDVTDVPLITVDVLRCHNITGTERLIFRTRNSYQWQRNITEFDEEFVGIDDYAAQAIIDAGIRLVGIDGLSIEPFTGSGDVHRALLRAGVVLLEGLNLAEVSDGTYDLVCAPLKLVGADGAPARVFLVTGR
ncbi:MAG TPA: cyclase family protein [Armatimonadota bacterium]|nr:cyclase family protein [Armatimonadota bacterium]